MFTMPEKTPELAPAISTDTEKKELCDTYSMPAPPARITAARLGLCTCEPRTRKIAVKKNATDASMHRPVLRPKARVRRSFSTPPARQKIVIDRNGSME